jgi:tyrosyl-tRNA synthetase
MTKEEIEQLEQQHEEVPHERLLQKTLAEDITKRVHSEDALKAAITASNILFGKSTSEDLMSLDEDTFLSVFDGVPQFEVSASDLETDIIDFLADKSQVFASKGEARRMIQSNAVSINKIKITADKQLSADELISNKYLLIQKGKKNYFLVIVS